MEAQWMLIVVLLLSCSVQAFTQECSHSCEKPLDCFPADCSSVDSGACLVPQDDGSLKEIARPKENQIACYRTCLTQWGISGLPGCRVSNTLDLISLEPEEGSAITPELGYTHYKIMSPGYEAFNSYMGSTLCDYHLLCNADGLHNNSILTMSIQDFDLEEPQSYCGYNACVDSLQIYMPHVGMCTLCGKMPLQCKEQSTHLPLVFAMDGSFNFHMRFRTNRVVQRRGFRIVVQCTDRIVYNTDGCITPGIEDTRKKREQDKLADYIAENTLRERRGGRVVHIVVPIGADVSYYDYTVRVTRGDEWLYKFQNIRYFQMSNMVEGHQTYYQSVPANRTFPGYGKLKIGKGVIHYVQTVIEPHLIPSEAESAMIVNLYRRIGSNIMQPDADIRDKHDKARRQAEGTPTILPITSDNIEEMDRQALRYGRACNGILRAAACHYQALFLGGTSADCDTI